MAFPFDKTGGNLAVVAKATLAGHVGQDVCIGHGRGETGMATYRLGLCAFGDLTVGVGPTGHAQGIGPGDRIALAGASVDMTQLLVADVGSAALVAAGSAFGVEGQRVTIDRRLSVVGDVAPSHEVTLDALGLDGVVVGLLGGAALRPGVTYRVTGVTLVDTLDALREHGVVSAAKPGDAVFCFAEGTQVDTPDGPRLIEDLRAGDLVTTLGNGSQPLRWVGSRFVGAADMAAVPDLMPVEFAAGAIGNTSVLRVSPQHRILLNDWRAEVYFGEDQVLIPAKAMINGTTIRQVHPAEGVTYVHLLFDRHEIIVSDGALSESFHPGETGLMALEEGQRRELELLFPALDLQRRRAAYPIVKLAEARALRLPG